MDEPRLRLPFIASIIVAAIACPLACADWTALAETETSVIAISNTDVGTLPSDFSLWRTGNGGPAEWTVVADATATGGHAIEQTSRDTTGYRFPLAIYKPITAINLDVSVRFKAVAGKVDRAGGLAVRLTDPDNYYVVRANALEDNVRLYRMVNGKREQIEGADLKVTSDEWHTLNLRAEGEHFTVSFDGTILYTTVDKTFSGAGKVALWTKADSITRFDQLRIKTLP
jgi:hypothetical protein